MVDLIANATVGDVMDVGGQVSCAECVMMMMMMRLWHLSGYLWVHGGIPWAPRFVDVGFLVYIHGNGMVNS